MSNQFGISQRQDVLLKFIIQEFVRAAKPVSSALIHRKSRLHVSPATIRNEMNDLEQMGYLSQLHTSGGRIPTDKAYRYFVNSLNIERTGPGMEEKRAIRSAIAEAGRDPRSINKAMGDALSKLTANLVITGIDEDFFKFGLSQMMNMPEFHEFDRMFQLTNFFDEFDRMFSQLERQMFGSRPDIRTIQVSIGRENPFSPIKEESVIAAQYLLPKGFVGTLTLIGPTRMDYERNISLIKFAKEELERIT